MVIYFGRHKDVLDYHLLIASYRVYAELVEVSIPDFAVSLPLVYTSWLATLRLANTSGQPVPQ